MKDTLPSRNKDKYVYKIQVAPALQGVLCHFGICTRSFSCQDLDEKMNILLISIQ